MTETAVSEPEAETEKQTEVEETAVEQPKEVEEQSEWEGIVREDLPPELEPQPADDADFLDGDSLAQKGLNLLTLGPEAWDDSLLMDALQDELEEFVDEHRPIIGQLTHVPQLMAEFPGLAAEGTTQSRNEGRRRKAKERRAAKNDARSRPRDGASGAHQISGGQSRTADESKKITQRRVAKEKSVGDQQSDAMNSAPIPPWLSQFVSGMQSNPLSLQSDPTGSVRDQALSQMLLAWYWTGYYAGVQAAQKESQLRESSRSDRKEHGDQSGV